MSLYPCYNSRNKSTDNIKCKQESREQDVFQALFLGIKNDGSMMEISFAI